MPQRRAGVADSESSSDLQPTRTQREGDAEVQNELIIQAVRSPPLPESVGRFRPLGILGSGGGGIVYLANDPVLNRRVAVKVPKVNGSLSDFPFLTEARAAARLKHPHVVQIFDVGSLSDGRMFIAMEFVGGGSLAARLKREHLTWQDAAKTVAQVASAIDVAHQNKLLHRDLKPSNVLLDEHGNTKVADFGLSLSTDDTLFAGTSITGTPAYMSPEQASGNADQLTPKTDIWSIGVILYEALTGKRPFFAERWPDLQHKILKTEPVAPRTVNPGIPRNVEAICLECLRKKPEDRPASAAVIAEHLQAAVHRSEQVARRRTTIAWMTLLCAIVGGLAWGTSGVPKETVSPQSIAALTTLSQAADSKIEMRWPSEAEQLTTIDGDVDLLTVAPEAWDFDRGIPNSMLSSLPQSRQFSVASSGTMIFAWPVKLPRRFRWQSRFRYSEDGSGITLAWSVHPALFDDGTAGYLSDAVYLTRHGTQWATHVGRETWSGRHPSSVKPQFSDTAQLGIVHVLPQPDLIDIDLIVHDGLLQSLSVNGVLVDHTNRKAVPFQPVPVTTQPAAFIRGGRLTMISARISDREAEY
jgi:serine/threonine protein kinase